MIIGIYREMTITMPIDDTTKSEEIIRICENIYIDYNKYEIQCFPIDEKYKNNSYVHKICTSSEGCYYYIVKSTIQMQ